MRCAVVMCALLLLPACKDDKSGDKKADAKADGGGAKDDSKKKDDGGDKAKADGGDAKADGGDAKADGGGDDGGDTPKLTTIKPVKLVPEAASIIAGLDLAAVVAGPSWAKTKEGLDADAKQAIEVATKCKVGPDTWKVAVIGADPTTESVAMVLGATGIGKKETLDCIHAEVKAKNGQDPWTASADGKTLDMGDGAGHIVSDDMMVFASSSWGDAVKELMKGEGHAAADGALKSLVERTDAGKHVWFAGRLPPDISGMSALIIGTPAKDFSGWIDLSAGLELSVMAGVEDAAKAKTSLETQWNENKAGAAAVVPQGVIDSVKFGNKDGAVTVAAKASAADLEAMSKSLGSMLPPM